MNEYSIHKSADVATEISPCKDCQDRSDTCHSVCKLYIDWKEKYNEIKEKKNKERIISEYLDGRYNRIKYRPNKYNY